MSAGGMGRPELLAGNIGEAPNNHRYRALYWDSRDDRPFIFHQSA